jgi:hypothetical protein
MARCRQRDRPPADLDAMDQQERKRDVRQRACATMRLGGNPSPRYGFDGEDFRRILMRIWKDMAFLESAGSTGLALLHIDAGRV